MGWKSLGHDAVNSTTKKLEFEAREPENKMMAFAVEPEFYEKVKSYAKDNGLKMSQLCRYALAKEMRSA